MEKNTGRGEGVLTTQFEFVPEAGWPWTVSLCETINSLFGLIQLGFLPLLTTERILSHILLN